MSVLGLDSGSTVKYNHLPLGVPLGFGLGKGGNILELFFHHIYVSLWLNIKYVLKHLQRRLDLGYMMINFQK